MVISEYNIELRFLPSLCNAADSVSRLNWDPGREVTISNNTFRDVSIYNSKGEKLEAHQLFSEDKRKEMNEFFNESKRGPIVNILKVADTGII